MVIYGDAEEQFRLLFEAAPNGMIVTDHDGIINKPKSCSAIREENCSGEASMFSSPNDFRVRIRA